MSLRLVRVDDRLIHGQVIAVWMRALGADVIVVVDDETAADEFLAEILTLAAPPGVPVEVLSVDTAVPRLTGLATSDDAAFVLMRSPLTALNLRQSGVEIPVLNIGGMGARAGRSQLYRNISASPDELAAMRDLAELGTTVEIRIVADDHPVSLESLAKS